MKITIDVGNVTNFNLCASHWLKSCPQCSQKSGTPVFKLYPDAFGTRIDADGNEIAQSWCTACRSEQTSTPRQHKYTGKDFDNVLDALESTGVFVVGRD